MIVQSLSFIMSTFGVEVLKVHFTAIDMDTYRENLACLLFKDGLIFILVILQRHYNNKLSNMIL